MNQVNLWKCPLILPCCYSNIWQRLRSWKGHIVCSNCCFTDSSVSISDLLGLEKLTHSKHTEPKLSHNVCHHVNTNKGIRLLTWVVAPLSVIYSLKPHIPTHLKSLLRPDWDNLSHLGPKFKKIINAVTRECFIKSHLCLNSYDLLLFETTESISCSQASDMHCSFLAYGAEWSCRVLLPRD